MKFVSITKNEFEKYYNLLQDDFCFEERKAKQDELKALSNKYYKPCFIYDDEKLVGYFCYWEFEDFMYVEHFAILKELRGSGIGTKFFKWFLPTINKPFILEVEDPVDEDTIRRVNFYKNSGFVLNNYEYYQPSYHDGSDSVPMKIVSYKSPITKQQFNDYINTMLATVYAKNSQ